MNVNALTINLLVADPGNGARDYYSPEDIVRDVVVAVEEIAKQRGLAIEVVPQRGERIAEFSFLTASEIKLDAAEFLMPDCPSCGACKEGDVCPMPCTCGHQHTTNREVRSSIVDAECQMCEIARHPDAALPAIETIATTRVDESDIPF